MRSIAAFGLWLALLAAGVNGESPYSYGESPVWGNWDGNRGGNGFGSGAASDSQGESAGFDYETAERNRTTHGIIATVCFVILFPVGAIMVRTIPSRHTWLIHGITQAVAFVLYVAAVGLGIRLIQIIKIPPNGSSLLEMASSNAHPIIGIVVLVIMFFLIPLGYVHHLKFKSLKRRTIWSYIHLWFGRISITLGIINGGLGLRLAGASDSIIIAYSVVGGIAWLLWVVTAIMGEMQRRKKTVGHSHGAETRARANNIPPSRNIPPGVGAPAAAHSRNGNHHHHTSSGDPSPPYTPGPIYGGPPVYRDGEGTEMRPVKSSTRGSRSGSSASYERTTREGSRRY
ncbi:hypothetical protein F5Y04DRAFT_161571 [Hypomontagnella monticulosa]|nr:hypothetical protein F5Y04DRAFT_161571 [Hypomontagnella monticulosa]